MTVIACFLAICRQRKGDGLIGGDLTFCFCFSAINVVNALNEVLHFLPISLFIPTLDPFPVNIAANAFIKSQI